MINRYSIQNAMTSEQLDQLYNLTQQMWWSVGRSKEDITTILKHCLPFALIDNSTQHLVGFARVLTDEIRYAYIYDVMIEKHIRNQGIGKMIMHAILSHPRLSRIKHFELTCAPEMTSYYNMFGFSNNFGNVVSMRLTKEI